MGKATANFPEFGPRSAAGKEADGPQGGGRGDAQPSALAAMRYRAREKTRPGCLVQD
jgi:hypothetical protein